METMAEERMRVLIADDRACARRGLRALLATWPTVEVVREASDGQEAVRLVGELQPHVVLMDVRMPGLDGLEATRLMKGKWPEVRVFVLSMHSAHRAEALASGADGFLVKGEATERLMRAVLGHAKREQSSHINPASGAARAEDAHKSPGQGGQRYEREG
jgi:DNA-binding NarL/FixJ family response regulator